MVGFFCSFSHIYHTGCLMKELENTILCPYCGGTLQYSWNGPIEKTTIVKTFCPHCHHIRCDRPYHITGMNYHCPACFSPLIYDCRHTQLCSNSLCHGYFISSNLAPSHPNYSLFELGHNQFYSDDNANNILVEIVYNHVKDSLVLQESRRYHPSQFGFTYDPDQTFVSQLFINVFKRLYNERT